MDFYSMTIQRVVLRHHRGNNLRPINSVKNIVDSTVIGATSATISTVLIGGTVNAYAGAVTDIPIGAKVNSVYLFIQAFNTDTIGNIDWYFIRRPSGTVNPVPGATGGNVARKFIMHEEKGLPGTLSAGSPPLTFRGVIRIPRGRQRFAEGDVMQVVARSSQDYSFCLKAIYKFYQ